VAVFKVGSPYLLLDYRDVVTVQPIVREGSRILFSSEAASQINSFFRPGLDASLSHRIAVVLIDPGHGGKDWGANREYRTDDGVVTVKEKEIVLTVAKRLQGLLSEAYPEKQTLLTRDSDDYTSLETRTEKANEVLRHVGENEAVIFISVHANAALVDKPRGFEVWYLKPEHQRNLIDEDTNGELSEDLIPVLNTMLEMEYLTESVVLAKFILDELQENVGNVSPNRGLKAEEWYVVRKSKMPAVLLELGFISNREEAFLMRKPDYLQKLTEAIYNGVVRFIDLYEKTLGFTG
jgi:N-acetylmuramoyl-L-alanine amidase